MLWARRIFALLVTYVLASCVTLGWYVLIISKIGQHIQPSEVILVLGGAAPNGQVSGMLQERLNEAIWLYEQGYAPYILVSGGVGDGDALSEAAVMRRYLVEFGIPTERILVENRSKRTWENLAFSKIILDSYNFHEVILVTSGFHMARVVFTADCLGYKRISFSRSKSRVHDWAFLYNYLREIVGLGYYFIARNRLNNNPEANKRAQEIIYIPQYIIFPLD